MNVKIRKHAGEIKKSQKYERENAKMQPQKYDIFLCRIFVLAFSYFQVLFEQSKKYNS